MSHTSKPGSRAGDLRIGQLHDLQQRRWRALVEYPGVRHAVEASLAPVAEHHAQLRRTLRRWSTRAGDVVERRPGAIPKFREVARQLAKEVAASDRWGLRARRLEDLTRAYVERCPTVAGLAHITTAEAMGERYLQLRNRLLAENLGLVRIAVVRMRVPPEREQDMLHEGIFGLVRALEMFDPNRGTRFSTYAMYWIRTEIGNAMTTREREIRVPAHVLGKRRAFRRSLASLDQGHCPIQLREMAMNATGLTERQLKVVETIPEVRCEPKAPLQDPVLADPATAIHRQRLTHQLQSALPELTPRERTVLHHRFELEGQPFRTFSQLGRELQLSRERVRQIQVEALGKLRFHLSLGSADHAGSECAA